MESSEREDYLEAVLVRSMSGETLSTAKDIASDLDRDEDTVSYGMKSLAMQGDLVVGEKGDISLTPQGRGIAERVLKKHRVLQCFLGEILGMDEHAASDEACVLEHSISDTTIHRIGNYVKKAGSRRGMHRGSRPHDRWSGRGIQRGTAPGIVPGSQGTIPHPSPTVTRSCSLVDATESVPLTVVGITGGEHLNRLIDLGVIPGEVVILRRRLHNNAVVLQVKECDIALSPEIAGTILVEKL